MGVSIFGDAVAFSLCLCSVESEKYLPTSKLGLPIKYSIPYQLTERGVRHLERLRLRHTSEQA